MSVPVKAGRLLHVVGIVPVNELFFKWLKTTYEVSRVRGFKSLCTTYMEDKTGMFWNAGRFPLS